MSARLVKHKPLTKEQQKLVMENLWVAGRQAYRFHTINGGNTGVFTKEDLESVGRYALCVAASRWEGDRGVKFSTYAWATVTGYIQHSLRDHSRMVKIPRWALYTRHSVKKLQEEGKTEEEIMEELSLSRDQIFLISNSWKESYKSLDYTRDDESRSFEIPYYDDDPSSLTVEVDSESMGILSSLSDSEIRSFEKYLEGRSVSRERKKKFERIVEELGIIMCQNC